MGNEPRKIVAEMLRDNLRAINSKFLIKVQAVEWPEYLEQLVYRRSTLFIIGWLAYYPDPHNFVMPFMHSEGDFAYFQSFSNKTIDELIEEGIRTVNETCRR